MKTHIIMLTALIAVGLVLAGLPLTVAEDDVSVNEPALISAADDQVTSADAALDETEDVGALRMGWKQVGVWFTFNQEKKAEKELDLARLQLIRAKIAAKNGDSDAVETALEAHERIMERVQARVDAASESGVENAALVRAINVHEARIQTMNAALEGSELTEAQRTRLEARLAHAENVTAGLQNVQAKIQERIRDRVQELKDESMSGADDSESEDAESEDTTSGNGAGSSGNGNK